MSLRRKIFTAFVLILGLTGAGMVYWVQTEARNSYAHVVEEILADLAQLFAAQIQSELDSTANLSLQTLNWEKSFGKFKDRRFQANILNVVKTTPALDAYITDVKGRVVYSSRDRGEIGKDFSQWRDVALALQGKYGARATRSDKGDKKTSVYYVAAPLYSGAKLVGVVSVFKARASVTTVLDYFFQKMILGVALVFLLAVLFGWLLFVWITAPIERLKNYAFEVSEGRKVPAPAMPHRELQNLTDAFEQMRVSVEGRKTIERFTQSLVHELKSPLAAVRGSAELMLEPMPESQRQRFLRNILEEGARAEKVLQQILSLAALESQTSLTKIEPVDLSEIFVEAQNALVSIAKQNQVTFENALEAEFVTVEGDRFLLTQVARNILENAVEFSEARGVVRTAIKGTANHVQVRVIDDGSGIPEFARDKIYEKFFSLERPRTGKKGTGLGLSFVREVLLLHRASIIVESPAQPSGRGTCVELLFPRIWR